MVISLNNTINGLEARVNSLEHKMTVGAGGPPTAHLDGTATVVDDPLDWARSAGLWASYTTIGPIALDPDTGRYTGGQLSTPYGMPQAAMVGNMCILSGLVKRVGPTLIAGSRWDAAAPMFGLPAGWRPTSNVPLPCVIGNTPPGTQPMVATGWIEVRPDSYPTTHSSGGVYLVAGNSNLSASTGWVALQGVFPCLRGV